MWTQTCEGSDCKGLLMALLDFRRAALAMSGSLLSPVRHADQGYANRMRVRVYGRVCTHIYIYTYFSFIYLFIYLFVFLSMYTYEFKNLYEYMRVSTYYVCTYMLPTIFRTQTMNSSCFPHATMHRKPVKANRVCGSV